MLNDITVTGQALTTASVANAGCIGDCKWWVPSPLPTYHYIYPPWTIEPHSCIGKSHVFECDHVARCKCGRIKRVMTKKGKRDE